MLTGGVIAVVLALVGLWQLFGWLDLTAGMTAALLALFLAIVLIFILLAENNARASEYESAVAPLYAHHPVTDEGINVLSITTCADPLIPHRIRIPRVIDFGPERPPGLDFGPERRGPSSFRSILIRVEPKKEKVLFFVCAGDVKSVITLIGPMWSTDAMRTPEKLSRVLTPTMFEVNLGEYVKSPQHQVEVQVAIDSEESVHIASIEWRDVHR